MGKFWNKIKNTVGGVVAATIGGPVGLIAGDAVRQIKWKSEWFSNRHLFSKYLFQIFI